MRRLVLGSTVVCAVVCVLAIVERLAPALEGAVRPRVQDASSTDVAPPVRLEPDRVPVSGSPDGDARSHAIRAVPFHWRTSPALESRVRRMDLPELLLAPEAYAECEVLNPSGRSLGEDELARLASLLETGNVALEERRTEVLRQLHEWMEAKALLFNEGQPAGTEEARELAEELYPDEDCFVGLYTNRDPSFPDLVIQVTPGEYAPLDVAYDDAWSEAEEIYGQIAVIVAGSTD